MPAAARAMAAAATAMAAVATEVAGAGGLLAVATAEQPVAKVTTAGLVVRDAAAMAAAVTAMAVVLVRRRLRTLALLKAKVAVPRRSA